MATIQRVGEMEPLAIRVYRWTQLLTLAGDYTLADARFPDKDRLQLDGRWP